MKSPGFRLRLGGIFLSRSHHSELLIPFPKIPVTTKKVAVYMFIVYNEKFRIPARIPIPNFFKIPFTTRNTKLFFSRLPLQMQQPQPQQRHSTTRRKEEVLFSVIRSAISTTSTSAQTICTINNLQNKYCAQFKY